MTPWFRKTPNKKILAFFCTYVCRALNHLISRDPQMLEPWFWCQNISIYGALMLLKLFQNWLGGFGVIFIFHFFEKFQFFGIISSTLWDTLVYPGTKKFPLMTRKLLMYFFDPLFLIMEGWGKIYLFRLCWIIWWPRWDTLILAGEKVTTHEISFLFLNNFCSTQLIYPKFYVWGFLGVP